MSIRLHIEHLVLEGLPLETAHGPALQAALAAELARLLAERGVGAGFRQEATLAAARGGEVHLPPDPKPELCGRRVAAAVYGSLVS